MITNIGAVLDTLREFLGFQMTIAEWIGTAILAAIPYLVIGVIWSSTHSHLGQRGHAAGVGPTSCSAAR